MTSSAPLASRNQDWNLDRSDPDRPRRAAVLHLQRIDREARTIAVPVLDTHRIVPAVVTIFTAGSEGAPLEDVAFVLRILSVPAKEQKRRAFAALKARQQAVEDLQADRNMPVHLLNELVRQLPDGVYIGKSQGSIFNIVDLDRIEVLRGPASSHNGNATGGGISLM